MLVPLATRISTSSRIPSCLQPADWTPSCLSLAACALLWMWCLHQANHLDITTLGPTPRLCCVCLHFLLLCQSRAKGLMMKSGVENRLRYYILYNVLQMSPLWVGLPCSYLVGPRTSASLVGPSWGKCFCSFWEEHFVGWQIWWLELKL